MQPEVSRQAERQNLVLASGIIRSGMKSILNFRHKIEKYGFKCLEFGNAHPWLWEAMAVAFSTGWTVGLQWRFCSLRGLRYTTVDA